MSEPLERRWYWVRAIPFLPEQAPPPREHPEYERIVQIQQEARAKKLASLKPTIVKMWGPQIEKLLGDEPYTIIGPVECAP